MIESIYLNENDRENDRYIGDLHNATEDFLRFSQGRSWYKHLGDGRRFRLERRLGYQPKFDIEDKEDPEEFHWYFHQLDKNEETSAPVIIFNSNLGRLLSKEHSLQLLDFLNLVFKIVNE